MTWKREVLDLATTIGHGDSVLDYYQSLTGTPLGAWGSELEAVDDEIESYELSADERKGQVLFPMTEGRQQTAGHLYCMLAHAFRIRGYEPIMLLCNADFDVCMHSDVDDRPSKCVLCHRDGLKLFEAFGIESTHIDELLPAAYSAPDIEDFDDIHSATYRNIDVSRYAKASVRRLRQKGRLDYREEIDGEAYQSALRSCCKLTDVATAAFDQYDVSATVTNHAAYMYGGIYLDVATNREIPAVTFMAGFEDGTLIFGNNQNRSGLPIYTDPTFVENELTKPLSETELERIHETMEGRATGDAVRKHYTERANKSINREDGTVIALFTNVPWDASLETSGFGLFKNPYSWVLTTIQQVADRDGTHLIIKTHPSELWNPSKDGSMGDWIRSTYDPLPENVDILPPKTDISPYHMMDDIDAGIVYNSTVGIELAYNGVPAIVCGGTHYAGFDFTIEPQTVSEYISLLETANELAMDEDSRDRARRYAHLFFKRKHIPFPAYYTEDRQTKMKYLDHDELTPGNEHVDFIVEKTLANEPIVPKLDGDVDSEALRH